MQVSSAARWARLALLLGAGLSLAPGPARPEVEAPLRGTLSPPRSTAVPGGAVALTLALRSSGPVDAVEVRLRLPEGMTLLAGPQRVELRGLVPGKERTVRWKVRVDRAGPQRIVVDAGVMGLQDAILRTAFSATVNGDPGTGENPPSFRTDEKGERQRVYGISGD